MNRRSGPLGRSVLAASVLVGFASVGAISCSQAPPDQASTAQSSNQASVTPSLSSSSAVLETGNPFRIGRPLVIPHAGGDGLFPEDTLYAYERSMAMGGDVVDLDVQLSGDSVPMAFHDSGLERTTNGSGLVRDLTAAELGAFDAGWGFEREGTHPFRGLGITIPTVEEVLDAFPTRLATLDLKDLRIEAVAPVCELLTRIGRTHDVYVGVDTNEQVLLFRKTCPEVHTSGTDDERKAMRAARTAGDTSFVSNQLVGQPGFLADDGTKRITASYLDYSHSKGIAVLTWVVDDPGNMTALVNMGIDGIYTRRPDVMIDLLHSLGVL